MRCSRILLYIALILAPLYGRSAHSDSLHDGGKDVSVLLFSTRKVAAITVSPLSPNAWTAQCHACAHKTLSSPLQLNGAFDLYAGGALRITELKADTQKGEERTATGLWHLHASGYGVDVVLTLPSEHYVAAVLNAETAPDEPPASLQALAIVARTYALNGTHYQAAVGHLPAELCDSTQCQAMRLGPVSPAIKDAVDATAGETLWLNGRRAEVFFSQNCGGTTEDATVVWPGIRAQAHLTSHVDPYCVRRGPSAWHAEIKLAELAAIARAQAWQMPLEVTTASVVQRSTSHRAMRIAFGNGSSRTSTVSAGALRFGINRALGWNRVRSDQYELAVRHDALVFDGRGHGHGVGLCQAGAAEMAAEHKSAREILDFYFPHAMVQIGPGDQGWKIARLQSLTVRSTQAIPTAKEHKIEEAWRKALQHFPVQTTLTPVIIFSPSTELFRQMTSQPGWALASTQGTRIVLQPEMVLHRFNRDEATALLHEMLHVLVESQASQRAPLWLREGLVEELSREALKTTDAGKRMTVEAIDAGLNHPETQAMSEAAHSAAHARVHALVSRYGISSVRGWLGSGVPADKLSE